METIYDHNPTPEELQAIARDNLPRERYLSITDEGDAWMDLAFLFNKRNDTENEKRAWSHIPERRDEFFRGMDVVLVKD